MRFFLGFVITIITLSAEMRVYVSHKSKIEVISLQNLKNLYLKKTKLLNDKKVIVYDNKDEYSAFYTHTIHKSDGQIHAYWMKQIFSGNRVPPKKIPFSEIIRVLNANPQAIYYSEKYLDAKVIYENK